MKPSLFLACMLLACLPLINQDGNSYIIGLGVILICLLKSIEAWIEGGGKWPSPQLAFTDIDHAVLLLIGSCFISALGSYFFRESLLGLAKYSVYAVTYLAFGLLSRDRAAFPALIGAALIGLFWSSPAGINQVLHGAEPLATWEDPNTPTSERLNRIYGLFLNPNLYGAYLVGLWPLGLGLYRFLEPSRKPFLWIYGGLIGLGVLSVYLIIQTGSRGAWLALAVQTGLALVLMAPFLSRRFLFTLIGLIPVGIVVSLVAKPALLSRILTVFSSYDHSSNSFRLHVWQATLRMIEENPWFGIGPGSASFYQAYGIYMNSLYSALGAYSLFLELTAELGLIGLGALIWLIFCLGRKASGIFSEAANQNHQDCTGTYLFTGSLVISLTGLLLTGLFDIVILRPQVLVLICLLFALMRNTNVPNHRDKS